MAARMTDAPRDGARRWKVGIDAQILRPAMSGVERAVYCLIDTLSRTCPPDMDLTAYFPKDVPQPPHGVDSAIRFVAPAVSNAYRGLRVLWDQAFLPHRAHKDGLDLLHLPAYVAPALLHTPYVLTVYDTIALKFPELCKRSNVLHYRLLMRRSLRRAQRVIVPSECTKRDVLALGEVSEDRIRVIPLGVSSAFHPTNDRDALAAVRNRYGLPDAYVLYVGNLDPKKNVSLLLDAFAEGYRSGRITAKLVIAGQKEWHAEPVRRRLQELRRDGMVQRLGPVPEADLPALYSAASLFVFPSLYEGFGLPPLEAMACGTPVITTRSGALPEVVDDAALALDDPDARTLRVAMEKALGNDFLRHRLRELGIRRAAEFTWERMAERTLAVYREVLQEAP